MSQHRFHAIKLSADPMTDDDYRQLYIRLRGERTDRQFVEDEQPGFSSTTGHNIAKGLHVTPLQRQRLRAIAGMESLPPIAPDEWPGERFAVGTTTRVAGKDKRRGPMYRPVLPPHIRDAVEASRHSPLEIILAGLEALRG